MADGNLLPFPTRSGLRIIQGLREAADHAHGHPQAPAGAHGFEEPAPIRERVEVTAGLTKVWAVRLDGMIWAQFNSATLALRCAEHVRGLLTLDALFPQPPAPEAA